MAVHRRCERCGYRLYDGDDVFTWVYGNTSETHVCEECFDELYKSMSRYEIAEAMGIERNTVDDFSISEAAYG